MSIRLFELENKVVQRLLFYPSLKIIGLQNRVCPDREENWNGRVVQFDTVSVIKSITLAEIIRFIRGCEQHLKMVKLKCWEALGNCNSEVQ